MNELYPESFDNVAVRMRGDQCAVFSVAPPLEVACWGDVRALGTQLGLPQLSEPALSDRGAQGAFLKALADGDRNCGVFRPARIGFPSWSGEIMKREAFRQRHRLAIFLGDCSREVTFRALEIVTGQIRRGGTIDVEWKQWDALADWRLRERRVNEICAYLWQTRQYRGSLTLFSELQHFNSALWEFVYDRPRVRLAWVAAEFVSCRSTKDVQDVCQKSLAFKNLVTISNIGVWPHLVLPVSDANAKVLPELVLTLLEATRGGSIDLVPAPLAALEMEAVCLAVKTYLDALVNVYRDPLIPLRLVSPLSWVASRLNARSPLVTSPADAGTEVAVLPNGDLYASEAAVGMQGWRLGNVLQDGEEMRWERLDIMPEAFSNALKPERCRNCDWRYRCGGVDAAVLLLEKRRASSLTSPAEYKQTPPGESRAPAATGMHDTPLNGGSTLTELYCEPRKKLFEEMLWGSLEAATVRQRRHTRERIELRADGIEFATVN